MDRRKIKAELARSQDVAREMVREVLSEVGWTQAELIRRSGVGGSTIRAWLTSDYVLGVASFEAIAGALGRTPTLDEIMMHVISLTPDELLDLAMMLLRRSSDALALAIIDGLHRAGYVPVAAR